MSISVPFELEIWSAQQCADYLKQSRQEFLRITRHREDFPLELPNRQRHWQALAVTNWALSGAIPQSVSANQAQKAA